MPERDLFANFDRMRREMDELFGDMLERTGLTRRRGGFSPAVDVVYVDGPPRAVVTAELAGVDTDELQLEIQGRALILSGRRAPVAADDAVYQQVEIERGYFRRVVELGAEVRGEQASARYEDGMLRVELPLVQGVSGQRSVRVTSREG
jgi:HSP20 family protein